PATSTLVTYKVCEKLNPTNCQTVTSTLVIGTGSLTVTPVTPLTVPNGISGGTTSSVLTGITLNGATVTNTNSVTISFSGLPTGVTTNTNGQLVIPAGTPAGTHTITYRVCEKLNPTNCQTVTSTLVIGTGSLTVTSTTLTHPNGTQGGTTTGTVLTGVKINGNPVNTASVTITWNSLPPNATGNASGTVTIAPNTPAGTYTISYTVCERLNGNSNCQSVTSQITIGGGSLTATPTNLTHPNGTQGGTTTGTVLTGVKINGNPVNTASVTITWNSLPPNATGNASGTVTIAPNTPAGTYTISYTVCERLNGNSNCQSVTSQITIGGGSLTATPTNLTHPNGTQGGTTTGTVLTGVKINGNPVNTASVTITWDSLPPNATGNASGTVTIAPNTPAGTYTISYTVCERLNGNSNCQSVTSQITIGGGNMTVTPTQLIVANGATGGTSVNNVLTGVTINGNPVNTNSVTITWNSLPPGFTGTNSGTVTVPANTPAGTYTVSYTVCERLNQNNNCKTVTSTIIVGNGNMIVVPTPMTVPNGTIGGTSTPSVLTGVVLNGNSNPAPNTVSITWNSLPPRATGNNDGTVNVAPNTPAGTYTVSYTICEALNSGHCTTVTSTITIGGGVLTVTPVTTLTVANGAQGGTTTSSVLTGVSLNGQPANNQSVTITFSGLPAGVTSNTNGQLVVAPGTPATNTTIYYTVCETLNANNNCHTYSTTLVIGTPSLSVTPRTYVIPDATIGGTTSSVLETVTIDGHTPSSQSVTITFGNLPVGIQTTTSGGFRVPAGTPTGIHTVTYTVCEVLNPDHCVTSIATIAVGNVPVVTPNAFTYTGTATVTTPSILDDDTVGTQSATTGTGGNVVINITSTPTGTVVPSLDANNGRVTIPAGTPPGIYTITYDVCTTATPTACTPGAVVITIPNVPVITPDDMVYTDTTTTTAGNILTNDRVGTQSATAGNGGNVSITVTIPATPKAPGATVPTLNPNTGVVTVPAGTPSGTYTITYKICTTATPTSCDTGVVTITVSGTVTDAPDTNDVTAYTRINTPVTVGVTSSTTVTVSIPSQPANGTAVSNGDGTITYTPNNGFKGTDSFEYSLCNAAGCRTATISVRVTSELIIYNGVSIGGSDKNNHFHIEGIENYPNNTVRIYNRWGVKVFEMSGYNNTTKAFKGVSDARATLEASDNLPQGTYYYIIEYVDEHNKTQTETGWLYLKKN
ncbi:gliding motility-associated C-terminal domain-containing protein, partial [Capnocytophaga leadbetteri]|uniref:T9SS type B sorting domain-containing protein n=1 Tax=Capnocytophaga leadbetteri TaxID=327575 RepID=UPI0028E2367E